MHHQTEHKTWIPMIAIGLAFGFMLGYVVQSAAPPNQVVAAENDTVASSIAISKEDYQNEVNLYLGDFDQTGDAEQAYNSVQAMSVPFEYQDLHLRLVIAFGNIKEGHQDWLLELDDLKKSYSWLNL